MPPKVRITREEIINAAFEIVREKGVSAVNARTVAAVLGCSTQPIFSNFATMEELHLAVVKKADNLYQKYTHREMEQGKYPPYKASGMAYIRFAKEEKELFKLLFMRDRTDEVISEETEFNKQIEQLVRENTGLEGNDTKLFHLEIWAFVHGIATMFATDYFDMGWELVSNMLTDAYQGLRKQFNAEN